MKSYLKLRRNPFYPFYDILYKVQSDTYRIIFMCIEVIIRGAETSMFFDVTSMFAS